MAQRGVANTILCAHRVHFHHYFVIYVTNESPFLRYCRIIVSRRYCWQGIKSAKHSRQQSEACLVWGLGRNKRIQ